MTTTNKTKINKTTNTHNLMNTLPEFVAYTCKDRDPSHGYDHMKKVYENSMLIFNNEIDLFLEDTYYEKEDLERLVMIVSWLHDVADHKYDKDNRLRGSVKEYLYKLIPDDADLIEKIIDRISYSKENECKLKKVTLDWGPVLGARGWFVRDIVSDADKLEALGKVGLMRCVEYVKHKYLEDCGAQITDDVLVVKVRRHAEEKLLRLKDEFIRTAYGKRLATFLHDEFVEELDKFVVSFSHSEQDAKK